MGGTDLGQIWDGKALRPVGLRDVNFSVRLVRREDGGTGHTMGGPCQEVL